MLYRTRPDSISLLERVTPDTNNGSVAPRIMATSGVSLPTRGAKDGTFVSQCSLNRSVEYREERHESLEGEVTRSCLPRKNRVLLPFRGFPKDKSNKE